MKRLALVIVLALLSNLTSATLLWRQGVAGDHAVNSSMTVGATAIDHDDCHDSLDHDAANSSNDGHPSLKCHTCCPTFGFCRTDELIVNSTGRSAGQTPASPLPYADIAYAIYKPPKRVL